MYEHPYHKSDLSKFNILVTGGAGFIGSNLVAYLLQHKAAKVRVLDNLSNGYIENINGFKGHPAFEFMEGDIRDLQTCKNALEGIHFVFHLAALGSVPRSITDPLTSHEVNITGSLNMLMAAKESPSLIKMVYAASSSTFGDSKELPKVEGREGKPLSPYAVTKAVNEMYADVFSKVYGLHTIGLRYFNVFGPRQNPNNPYAAVIPIFCKCFMEGTPPTINGDGETSRDFTFVANVIQANLKALDFGLAEKEGRTATPPKHEVFNIACNESVTLNQLVEMLRNITGKQLKPLYRDERAGDVRHSLASIEKIRQTLGYEPQIHVAEGLRFTYDWYVQQNA